jgi:hypothetical protein
MVVEIAGVDYGPERLVIELDANGPVQLGELAESFHALERLFEREQRSEGGDTPPQTRLFVSKIESGSIIAELAPLLVMFSEPIAFMAATNTIKKFAENVVELLKKFAGEESTATPTSETVQDLQTFIKPLTGRKGAELGIVHARFEKREKDREVILEYRMKAPEINMADANLHKAVEQVAQLSSVIRHELKREVLMRLFQASVAQGKASGRTGDRAIIAALSDHDLPLYFAKQSNDYKKQITEDTEYPFSKGYIVDVSVEYEGDRMKSYTLVHLHKVIEL